MLVGGQFFDDVGGLIGFDVLDDVGGLCRADFLEEEGALIGVEEADEAAAFFFGEAGDGEGGFRWGERSKELLKSVAVGRFFGEESGDGLPIIGRGGEFAYLILISTYSLSVVGSVQPQMSLPLPPPIVVDGM